MNKNNIMKLFIEKHYRAFCKYNSLIQKEPNKERARISWAWKWHRQHSSIFWWWSEPNERNYDKFLIFSINFILFNSFLSRQNRFPHAFRIHWQMFAEEEERGRYRKIHITNLQIMSHIINHTSLSLCVDVCRRCYYTAACCIQYSCVRCVCWAILESIAISLLCFSALFLHSSIQYRSKEH